MTRRLERSARIGLTALLLAAWAPAGLTAPAAASVIYQYVGAPFRDISDEPIPAGTYTPEMRITARLEFPEIPDPEPFENIAGDLLSYQISDGRVTLDETNSTFRFADVQLDADGVIIDWQFNAFTEAAGLGSQVSRIVSTGSHSLEVAGLSECIEEPCANDQFSSDSGFTLSSFAVGWSIVPEPSTALLFGLGMLGLGRVRHARA